MPSLCSWCCCCFKRPKKELFVCPAEHVDILKRTTCLTSGQIRFLYRRFCTIGEADKDAGPPKHLLKRNFLSIAHLERNRLLPTILGAMFDKKRGLGFIEFATFLSTFQANTLSTTKMQMNITTKKKYRLLFNMYDTDNDGRITQEDLISVVHRLFGDLMDKESIIHIVTIIMHEMDTTESHQILFEDFVEALKVFDMDEALVTNIPEA